MTATEPAPQSPQDGLAAPTPPPEGPEPHTAPRGPESEPAEADELDTNVSTLPEREGQVRPPARRRRRNTTGGMVDWSALDPHADGVTRERFLHSRDAEAARLRAEWAREDAARARRKAETLALTRAEPAEPEPFTSEWTPYVEADRAAEPDRLAAVRAGRAARQAGTPTRWDTALHDYVPDDDDHQADDGAA